MFRCPAGSRIGSCGSRLARCRGRAVSRGTNDTRRTPGAGTQGCRAAAFAQPRCAACVRARQIEGRTDLKTPRSSSWGTRICPPHHRPVARRWPPGNPGSLTSAGTARSPPRRLYAASPDILRPTHCRVGVFCTSLGLHQVPKLGTLGTRRVGQRRSNPRPKGKKMAQIETTTVQRSGRASPQGSDRCLGGRRGPRTPGSTRRWPTSPA